MALWTSSGTTQVSRYQKVHFAIFWIFWSKMKITQADAPTIRMDCNPIQTNSCPHHCNSHHFYAGCPSLHNPPKLSWLGTVTKYAGLHTHNNEWYMIMGRQWYRLPELIQSNSNTGIHNCISVSIHIQICTWPSWCPCHSLSLAPINPDWFYQNGSAFLVPLTQVVVEKRLLNECSCINIDELFPT